MFAAPLHVDTYKHESFFFSRWGWGGGGGGAYRNLPNMGKEVFLTNANERVWHAPACSVDACAECVRHLQRFLEQLNSCNPVSNFWNIPEGILEVYS